MQANAHAADDHDGADVQAGTGWYMRRQPVRAIRWLRHGDHCDVRPGKSTVQCKRCGLAGLRHGEIFADGAVRHVCPGDWIVEDYDAYHVVPADEFTMMFEEVADETAA